MPRLSAYRIKALRISTDIAVAVRATDSAPDFLFEAQGALTCREQKFTCLRLATDNSQYRGDDQCAHSYSVACSHRRCWFPHLHKPVLRLLPRRLLPNLQLQKPMATCGARRSSSA